MNIELTKRELKDIESDCEIIIVVDGDLDHRWVEDRETLKIMGFKGKSEEVAFLPTLSRIYVGSDSYDIDEIRLAVSLAINSIKKTEYKSIKIGSVDSGSNAKDIRAIVEGTILGSYEFNMYKSESKEGRVDLSRTLIISLEDMRDGSMVDTQLAKRALLESTIISDATNSAKTIVNQAPDDMTPEKLANYATNLAKNLDNVECFVGDEKFLKEQKMGAFLAVSRSSAHKPRFIHLTYRPKEIKEKFVFVGKGLTYDSGGLSLKGGEHMVTMKSDKSGSATVISILEGAARLNLPFEIHAIVGACENMIGENAYKPDDILIARDGTNIEVRNTDAEGRLVLADCLSYACELKPDYLVDVATLTGACVVAVGEYTTGIMGHNSELKNEIITLKDSGELTSTLEFNRYLKKLLKSSVADISNISSSRYGGAITAGLFLDNFISDDMKDKWMHWDIAGPAYVEKAWGYNQAGASGAGVRLALYWMSSKLD